MAIRVTGMYSGLDTESIISELVSAKSVKKQKLVKAQTKLSWKQDAWKALNTKIYNFYTNVLDSMRYQGSYLKKTTKVSNSNAITVKTSDNAVDGTRTVKVNQLAKGAKLTGRSLETAGGVRFTGGADLATLRKFNGMDADTNLSGSFRVMGTQGEYLEFEVNENTTIDDVVNMIRSTGLNCNFDTDSQRIFVSSKNTGAVNNFYFMANDEGGMNALAALGLLSADDISKNPELSKWAGYATDNEAYDKAVEDEIAKRKAAYEAANEALKSNNDSLDKANKDLLDANQEILKSMQEHDSDYLGQQFAAKSGGKTISQAAEELYGDNGLYNKMLDAKAALDKAKNAEEPDEDEIETLQQAYDDAKVAYDDAEKDIFGLIDDIVYGELQPKKDEDGNPVYEQKVDEDGNLVYEQAKNEDGELVTDDDGNPVYDKTKPVYDETKPVMERQGGLKAEYDKAQAEGTVTDEMQAQVDSINKWYDEVLTYKQNKSTIESNNDKIAKNEAQIAENNTYLDDTESSEYGGKTKLEYEIREEFDKRIEYAQKSLDALEEDGEYSKWLGASKVNGQDAEVIIDGALFTSMDNTFSVNGLTITANEVTDKEITITTSNDTDGVYDMIKNFFKEYNSLINEMSSLYNAEASTGYEPLTSEEKEALSESEIEEWEKKIKDSLLRRDSTLSTVSTAMSSILLKGVTLNGEQWYLSDFGINTLGYFEAAENERNAYHIDGDADDDKTKANNNILKAMISNSPQAVMDFFTSLANNLYDELTEKMSSTTMSSAFTVYNDKQMKNEYNDYTDKIAREEEKLNALMDKWYSKFSKMEVAMSKLESRSSSLASILGGR
ncbi:MAG: flagellar filament capping protein FliD [Lachnospiraceae bacterium]|nr:flagellar filament capping protein FliD [Lachnospiraceae bacterium]